MRTRRARGGLQLFRTLRLRANSKSRHARSSARCRPLPRPHFHSDFSRGGNSKEEWTAGGRCGASFSRFQEKEAGGIQYKTEPRHTNFFKEWRGTVNDYHLMMITGPSADTAPFNEYSSFGSSVARKTYRPVRGMRSNESFTMRKSQL